MFLYDDKPSRRSTTPNAARRAGLAATGLVLALGATGCEIDSFLDPSVTGRWEHTPTSVPILERIAAIEGPEDQFVEYTDIQPEDMLPEITEYRTAPGDGIRITAYDLIATGRPDLFDRSIDPRGVVSLPQLGEVFVSGMTVEQVEDAIRQRMSTLVGNPLVTVELISPRQRTFTIMGAVGAPGPYFVPAPNYRLLEALNTAGGFVESVPYVYVIRQIALDPSFEGLPTNGNAPAFAPSMPPAQPMGVPTPPAGSPPDGEPPAEDLIDLIDELTAPSMSMVGGRRSAQPGQAVPPAPVIDLVEPDRSPASAPPAFIEYPSSNGANALGGAAMGGNRWIFADGRWTQLVAPDAPVPASSASGEQARRQLVTQRVIRVPMRPLILGDASVNMVIRPGDIIRVPRPDSGNIYMAGQVVRVGVYGLPPEGRLTLMRAIDAAGGLTGIAIPARTDITRMVGPDRQATIRVNLKAIAEGTQPDLFMKPDDRVNVGTNFWALPLAVVRNGFRFSYGFGFLLDRNFGNDVFGPPPTDQN
ncbi:MAG: polysaccharide biosynthesis/export family protein [Planctomycetota bacterium]